MTRTDLITNANVVAANDVACLLMRILIEKGGERPMTKSVNRCPYWWLSLAPRLNPIGGRGGGTRGEVSLEKGDRGQDLIYEVGMVLTIGSERPSSKSCSWLVGGNKWEWELN